MTDKEPLKKAKTPQGRFDSSEEKSKDVLQSEDGVAGGFSSLAWTMLFRDLKKKKRIIFIKNYEFRSY